MGTIRVRRRHAYAVCAVICGALAVPSAGFARAAGASGGSGGSGLATGTSTVTAASPAAPAPVQSGNVTVSVSGGGITVVTRASAMLRNGLSFTGTAPQSLAGQTVVIERSGNETNWTWAPTVSATVLSDGSFAAVWHTNHIGRFAIRAVVAGPEVAQVASATGTAAASGATTPPLTVTVYRPSLATLYGPGFYGDRTACGERLRPTTIGVANRTLRCGMSVAVYYQGRTMIVPVIDRGPYANGADWDLTEATARALRIPGTAQIGAVSLPTQ
jgi:rare lipoprotein A